MRPPAGTLKDSIRIESHNIGHDASTGQRIDVWTTVLTVRADIKPLRGKERWSSISEVIEDLAKITINWHPSLNELNATYRVVDLLSGAIYSIESVVDIGNMHQTLELMASKLLKDQPGG